MTLCAVSLTRCRSVSSSRQGTTRSRLWTRTVLAKSRCIIRSHCFCHCIFSAPLHRFFGSPPPESFDSKRDRIINDHVCGGRNHPRSFSSVMTFNALTLVDLYPFQLALAVHAGRDSVSCSFCTNRTVSYLPKYRA